MPTSSALAAKLLLRRDCFGSALKNRYRHHHRPVCAAAILFLTMHTVSSTAAPDPGPGPEPAPIIVAEDNTKWIVVIVVVVIVNALIIAACYAWKRKQYYWDRFSNAYDNGTSTGAFCFRLRSLSSCVW